MAKTFKKNQRIVATLPTGKIVEGIYIEPYGSNGHSFYVNEYDGADKNGKPKYKRHRYGVLDENIEAVGGKTKPTSDSQYRSWLKRAIDLESRIKDIKKQMAESENDDTAMAKLNEKLSRTQDKLSKVSQQLNDFENQ